MRRSHLVLVGGRIPDELVKEGLWKSDITMVLSTVRGRNKSPHPWLSLQSAILHCSLGGVTDSNSRVLCDHQTSFKGTSVFPGPANRLRKDLRWVLKGGEEGRAVCPVVEKELDCAARQVNYVRDGEIKQRSLWPLGKPDVLVHTVFRQDRWVKRSLSRYEKLLAVDAPERLMKLLPDPTHQTMMYDSITVPLKVLQFWIEHVTLIFRHRGESARCEGLLGKRKAVDTTFTQDGKRGCRRTLGSASTGLPTIYEDMEVEDMKLETFQGEGNSSTRADRNLAATKNDSSQVPVELWDHYLDLVVPGITSHCNFDKVVTFMRSRLLNRWKRNVTKSFFKWERNLLLLSGNQENHKDIRIAARDCIHKASNASWWSWDMGSRPFFWRWPPDYQEVIREGVPVWFRGPGIYYKVKQKNPGSEEMIKIVKKKLANIRDKGYVEKGQIDSLMPFFNVPKGKDDVRMVYDGSKSGLNDCLWSPWFPLPTVDCLVRALQPGYSMADNDVGEMFHNFMLHKDIRKYCGLDLTLYFRRDTDCNQKEKLWERWNRLAMGLRTSPYCAIQGMLMAKEVILGDQFDQENNVFNWEALRLNLPGDKKYTPSEAWVTKVRRDGTVAADVFVYVDDIRSCAPTELEAWRASQRTSSILGMLGLQDAARKRREPGMETGSWTGSVVWSSNGKLVVMTSQEKWDKTRAQLKWMSDHLQDSKGLDGKRMKSIRGFLVYVARTYTSMVPYLKGIHATIDSWRKNRNIDGWKYPGPRDQWQDGVQVGEVERKLGVESEEEGEPLFVFPVPRLHTDLLSLLSLTNFDQPPHRIVRMSESVKVVYGFGDASKQGFGSTIVTPDNTIHWTSGHWSLDDEQKVQMGENYNPTLIQERSSNYRELRNLVEELEKFFQRGLLNHREMFMFTDNSTAEAAYYKGTSSSEHLFDLVLRLRKLEMSGLCKIHLVHVAGTRMIWQGTDGLSRGDRNAGVMAGEEMLSFVPLNRSAFNRSPMVKEWIDHWGGPENNDRWPIHFLEPNDWPKSLITEATYVWSPPPAAADVAAEYMAQSIHKRPTSTHIFVCPRLMTANWFRLILKATDVMFRIPTGCDIWGSSQHEPLIVAISFPLRSIYPWKRKGVPEFERGAKVVQGMLSCDFDRSRIGLREFFIRSRTVAPL
jgi:hypothetical protein